MSAANWTHETFQVIAGILALAGMKILAARDSRPADVTIYVKDGGASPPGLVDDGARANDTRMYARIGVRLAWRNGTMVHGPASGSPVSIQVRGMPATAPEPPVRKLCFCSTLWRRS